MKTEFSKLLKKTYRQYKDEKRPPVPVKLIKEYLELEGIVLEDTGEL